MEKYHKTVIFTKVPLNGYFKFKDEFQIYPVSSSDLNSKKYQHYPIYLEFAINEDDLITPKSQLTDIEDVISKEQITATATIQSKQDKILQLLNLFSTHIFFRYRKNEGSWVLPLESDGDNDQLESYKGSKFYFSYFDASHLDLKIDKLTILSNEYSHVDVVSFHEYYQIDPNYDYDRRKPITLPDNILIGLDAYYNLEKKERSLFDAAIKYSVLCMESLSSGVTLGVLSGFTAIETVMNFYYSDYKPEICVECGQPKYKIAKRYTDFLLKFIGNGEGFKKQFSNLYSLRSKIVHTGFSFASEQFWNELEDVEQDRETVTILQITMLSKLSIINYLILTHVDRVEKHYKET